MIVCLSVFQLRASVYNCLSVCVSAESFSVIVCICVSAESFSVIVSICVSAESFSALLRNYTPSSYVVSPTMEEILRELSDDTPSPPQVDPTLPTPQVSNVIVNEYSSGEQCYCK